MRTILLIPALASGLFAQTSVSRVAAVAPGGTEHPNVHADSSLHLPADFVEALSAAYLHGLPLAVAEKILAYPMATERLKATLNDWSYRDLWENSTIILGLSGEPSAYAALFTFLQRDDSPAAVCLRSHAGCSAGLSTAVSPVVYYAKANVPLAMGLLLAKLNAKLSSGAPQTEPVEVRETSRKIFEFLRSGARFGFACWPGFVWQSEVFGKDQGSMYVDLSLQCLDGLAVSGDRAAGQELQHLKEYLARLEQKLSTEQGREDLKSLGHPAAALDHETLSTMRTAIEDAIKKNSEIGARGLQSYYSAHR